MKKLFFVFTLLFFSVVVFGQDDNEWKLFKPAEGNTVKKDSAIALTPGLVITQFFLDFNAKKGNVSVSKDGRLDGLTAFTGTPQNGKPTVTMKGFRIQAFFDPDKTNVNQKRADYLAQFDEHPAYIDFLAPNFRLRIGDFRTKQDAEGWRDKIKVLFPDAIIVMDDIELPKLP
ncbi:MAG: SPOR domain-containing protein [Bacteroidota bacterium]